MAAKLTNNLLFCFISAEKRYACPGCHLMFKYKATRDKHHYRMHEIEVKDKHYSVCDHCGKHLTKSAFKLHMATAHGNNEKHLKCPVEGCPETFNNKYTLKHHRHVHTEGRKYPCQYCPVSYKFPNALRAHVRRQHTHEGCIRCKFCEKWYLNPAECQLHIDQIHLQLRSFACNYCDASFKVSYHLNRHLRGSHPSEFAVLFEQGALRMRKSSKYAMLESLNLEKSK